MFSFWALKIKRITFLLFTVLFLSFTSDHSHEAYEAVDNYKNVVFTLELHKDNTYYFEENFLDGSVWKDEGTWVMKNELICLKSLGKSKREHNYLKYDKAVRFKGDEFRVSGDTLFYEGKGNFKLNDYFKKLFIRKSPHHQQPKKNSVN